MARGKLSPQPPVSRPGEKAGRRLVFAFWDRALDGRRWTVKQTAGGSPLEALYRALGPEAPLRVIGLDRWYDAVDITMPRTIGDPSMVSGTSGFLAPTKANAARRSAPATEMLHAYTLRWTFVEGKPVVEEVLPYLNAVGELFPPTEEGFAAAPGHAGDGPAEDLDPVASALWRAHVERDGLPFVARCLALWWRVEAREDLRGHLYAYPPQLVASSIAVAVGMRSVIRFDRRAAAAAHAVDLDDVPEVEEAIRHAIGRSLTRTG